MALIDWNQLSDKDLLLALAQGEKEALNPLFNRHSGKVYQLSLRGGLPKERAEDLVQIVFLQMWRKKHLYSPQHEALAWIFVISKSELRDYKNREKRHLQPWEDTNNLSQIPSSTPNLDRDTLPDLNGLSHQARKVVEMRYFEDKEFNEIALALGKTEPNIRKILSRALMALKNRKESST